MDIEIRHLTPEDMTAFHELVSYVFAFDPQFHEDAGTQLRGADPWMLPDRVLAAVHEGVPVSTLGATPIPVRVNGRAVPTAAVTTVGTDPGYRRRGLQRRVMTKALEWHRDSGLPIAMLWASFGAIYQRYGYGLASAHTAYEFEPTQAVLREEVDDGFTVRLADWNDPDVRAEVQRLYAAYAAPRTLIIDRDEEWWRTHQWYWEFERKQDARVFLAIARDASGRARGYIAYRTKDQHVAFEPGPSQELKTQDFVAPDVATWRALWNFIRAHDLVKTVKFEWAPEDDIASDLLLEPRALRRRTGDAMWLRMVDVAPAIEARGYEPDAEGSVTLGIEDGLCPWNDGAYRVTVEGGSATVQRVRTKPQLSMPVAALSPLYSGFRTATALARAGRIEGSASALRTADRLFATAYRPHVMDGF